MKGEREGEDINKALGVTAASSLSYGQKPQKPPFPVRPSVSPGLLCLLPFRYWEFFLLRNLYFVLCAVTSVLRTDSLLPSLSLLIPYYSFSHSCWTSSTGPLSGFLLRSLWLQFAQMSR